MTAITIRVTNNKLLASLRNLYEQGDITIEQYGASLRRYKEREENGR